MLYSLSKPYMFKKKKAIHPKEKLVPLQDCIFCLRTLRILEAKDDSMERAFSLADCHYSIRQLEREIERHGYKKIDGRFYKLSDFEQLSPLEI